MDAAVLGLLLELLAGAGGGRTCPVRRPVCPHDCGEDDALVHGYCCGCARPYDHAPIRCPDWLQCPIRSEPLCTDYRFVMDCCCAFGRRVK